MRALAAIRGRSRTRRARISPSDRRGRPGGGAPSRLRPGARHLRRGRVPGGSVRGDARGLRERLVHGAREPGDRPGGYVLGDIPRFFWEEQFGLVLAEAMAAGLPIVASLSGAIPEVCGDAASTLSPAIGSGWRGALPRDRCRGRPASGPRSRRSSFTATRRGCGREAGHRLRPAAERLTHGIRTPRRTFRSIPVFGSAGRPSSASGLAAAAATVRGRCRLRGGSAQSPSRRWRRQPSRARDAAAVAHGHGQTARTYDLRDQDDHWWAQTCGVPDPADQVLPKQRLGIGLIGVPSARVPSATARKACDQAIG